MQICIIGATMFNFHLKKMQQVWTCCIEDKCGVWIIFTRQ